MNRGIILRRRHFLSLCAGSALLFGMPAPSIYAATTDSVQDWIQQHAHPLMTIDPNAP